VRNDVDKSITILKEKVGCSFQMVDLNEERTESATREKFKTIVTEIRCIPVEQGQNVEKADVDFNVATPAISFNDWQMTGNPFFSLTHKPRAYDVKTDVKVALVKQLVSDEVKEAFIENADGVEYFDKEDGQYRSLMNFTIEPMGTVTKNDHQGSGESFIEVKVICDGQEILLNIERKQYKQVAKIILTVIPESYIEADVNNSSKLIQKYLATKYKEKKYRLYNRLETVLCGWTKTLENRMVYIHGGMADMCSSTKIIPQYQPNRKKDIFLAGFDILSIGNTLEVILTPFIFAHLGFLTKLFEDARFRPTFSLFLRGETNSYKTSLALEIFNIFETDPEKKIATFKFTQTALEMALAEAIDDVFVLDDMSLSIKGAETEQNLKVEHILRSVGDSSSKSRASKNLKEQVKFKFRNVMCITGEDYTNGSLSSQVRMVSVEVNRQSYNPDKIGYLKQNRIIMREYFGAFIHFLEENYEKLVGYINYTFPILRNEYQKILKFPRLIDSLATLVITSRIIIEFCLYCEAMDKATADQLRAQFEQVLTESVQQSEESSKTIEPEQMYVDAINQLWANKVINVADNIKIYELEMSKYIGYRAQNELWFKHETLFDVVSTYWMKQGRNLSTSVRKIHKMLYVKGISKGYDSSGKTYYLKKSNLEGRPNMLCINEEKFRSMLGNDSY